MTYIFTLLDTKNNRQIDYKDNYDWKDENAMIFQWTENNFDCDCNRRICMYGVGDYECGDEVKLLKITDNVGNIIYEENKEG